MSEQPQHLTLQQWDGHYARLKADGLREPAYGGTLSRHLEDGDLRLRSLLFDSSAAALDLWNFLLTEEDRLRDARASGQKLIGAMKDLGTVPVLAYASPRLRAFYPDGAWWIPCVMELSAGLLDVADSMGIDSSFCPVRAMLGAFATEAHFPIPDLLVCSVGAVCDDFSAIAQRLNGMGHPILWWEVPHRRRPDPDEAAVELPGGWVAPEAQVAFVRAQLARVRQALENAAGHVLQDRMIMDSIRTTNRFRAVLGELRHLVFTAPLCPLPALEMLIAEMISIHFCSDQQEALRVLEGLLEAARGRVEKDVGFFGKEAVRVFWVNPVADIQAMNLLEQCGGRICGSEYLFSHALDLIPEDLDCMEALARMALADPMVGPSGDRAERICRDIERYGAEAVVISRIPGASHCALESGVIADSIGARFDVPTLELEVPPLSEPMQPTLRTRLQGLVETVRRNRKS